LKEQYGNRKIYPTSKNTDFVYQADTLLVRHLYATGDDGFCRRSGNDLPHERRGYLSQYGESPPAFCAGIHRNAFHLSALIKRENLKAYGLPADRKENGQPQSVGVCSSIEEGRKNLLRAFPCLWQGKKTPGSACGYRRPGSRLQ
jgi:hypothetical protein